MKGGTLMTNILYYTEKIDVGGVENMMLQWVEHASSDIHIDLLVSKVVDETTRQCFLSAGCDVYEANCSVRNLLKKAKVLKETLKNKKYDIVHIHTSMATDFFILSIAKRYGIKHRIAHSHNVPIIPRFVTRLADKVCKPLLRHYTTDFFGCSKQAAIALFGNKKKYINLYTVIKNGIDVDRYKFSLQNRDDIRKEFGVAKDEYLIGSVGRLDFQKNYGYLLEVIDKSEIDKSKVKVLIIGDGYEREALLKYAKEHNIHLLLPGKRSDVNRVLSSFDLFVLTSRYEGFPVVMMEAQANGVDCLVSEAIPEEAMLNTNLERISLDNIKLWLDIISKYISLRYTENMRRIDKTTNIFDKGYDIGACAYEMIQLYLRLVD